MGAHPTRRDARRRPRRLFSCPERLRSIHVDPALILRGFILGFTIAAAVGPISLLVIRRTIGQGQLYGLVSGLGVATADATYGAIAAFGLAAITDVLVNARVVLGLVGGLFLLWMAWQTMHSSPTEAATPAPTGR